MVAVTSRCFLAQFSDTPCDGRLIRAHLISRQVIRRELHRLDNAWQDNAEGKHPEPPSVRAINDPRSWVPACGGPMGISAHHGMFDSSRTLKIPRHALPEGLEEFAAEWGLEWYLEREFGALENAA